MTASVTASVTAWVLGAALTGAGSVALVAFGAWALVDWWAVARDRPDVERWAKPATLVALVAVAVLLDPAQDAVRAWFVAALVLSLAGDVLLLPQVDRFVAGLAAFLVGHLAYIAGFVAHGVDGGRAGVAAVAVAAVALPLGTRVAAGARRRDPALLAPVLAYITVISAMVVAAAGTGLPVAAAGALLFYASDAAIGWSRFVAAFAHHRLLIIVTYHLGQAALVLSLVA